MLLHCPSRKCNTNRDQKLKVDTGEVICMDCNEVNNTITDIMKSAMKGLGEVYRTVKSKKAFMYKCPKCTIDRGAKIVDDQALCEACSTPLNLNAPTIEAIKIYAPKLEEKVVEADQELSRGKIKRRKE